MAETTEKLALSEHFEPTPSEEWTELATATLKGKSPERLKNIVGTLDVEPIYFEADALVAEGLRGAGARGWIARQRYLDVTLRGLRQEIRADHARDIRSYWLKWHPGGNSVSVRSLDEFLHLTEDIDDAEWILDASRQALEPLALLHASANCGRELNARVYSDPIAEFASVGVVLQSSFNELFDAIWWAADSDIAVGCIDSQVAHNAGADPALELAWIAAAAVEMHRRSSGNEDAFAWWLADVAAVVAVDSDIFVQIAKLRALRVLWAKITKALVGESRQLHVHAVSSWRTLAKRDPWTNILRGTAQGFAAAVGGADAITMRTFDETIGIPDELGVRLASNTQNVLAGESHIGDTHDPSGGSWFIESLTDQLARNAWTLFQEIEAAGGLVQALRNQVVQTKIQDARREREHAIHRRKQTLVGVNDFVGAVRQEVERPPRIVWQDSNATRADIERTVESLANAFGEGASWDTLQTAGSSLIVCEAIEPWRDATDWEDLSNRAHATEARVFLANIGPIPRHKARAGFTQRLLEAAGFEVIASDGFESADALMDAFKESGALGAIICGHDDDCETHAEAFAEALSASEFVGYAGRPDDGRRLELQAAGVSHFVFIGADVYDVMSDLVRRAEEAE